MPAVLLKPIVKRSLFLLAAFVIAAFALLLAERSSATGGVSLLPSVTEAAQNGPPKGGGPNKPPGGGGGCKPPCGPSKG